MILINDESFSTLLNVKRPETIAHEAFHIVEYEQYDQIHNGEEVDEYARKLVELNYLSLNDDDIEREYIKICSGKKGRGKYDRLRIITKFRLIKLEGFN